MKIYNQNLNIRQIADSGQCFRMNPIDDQSQTRYCLIAYGRYLEVTQLENGIIEFSCSETEYYELWEEYFDLNYDYGVIIAKLKEGKDIFLKEAANYGSGIRILKQEPFEATISFLISQNKNIPAIKSCIEAISRRYGERKVTREGKEYWTFPTPEILARADKMELRALKTGYRDEYIIRTAQAVTEGTLVYENLKTCSYEEAITQLKSMHGIGEKVANCIALYGLHHIEGFPVDVWILRVLKEIYNNNFHKDQYHGYAGIIQQYMFYYFRFLKGK